MSTQILDVVALSPLQRGLYSVSTTSGEIDPYLVTFAMRIEDLADVSTLRKAFDQVLQRYPHLGGSVLTDGLPHPVLVTTTAGQIGWTEVDLRGAADPEAAARQRYWDEGRRRIDLDNGPLFRVTVARVGAQDYELICTAHHIVVDGWSIPLLFADLLALHRGEGATLPPAPPLREHAAWLAGRDTAASIQAWTTALAGLAPMPMIAGPAPADLPVLGEARFDRAETETVTRWARAHGLTLNTVLQMAWARVLSGLTGRDDVVFGQTTSGRDASLPHADRLVGALVTTIPVRVRMDDRAPAAIGAHLQREVAALRAHEYLGIAEITRQASIGQLFDTLLVFENTPMGSITARMPLADGATLTPRRIDSPSHYPIAVVPVVEDNQLITRVEIRPDLTTRFTPDRLAHRLLAVVRSIVDAETGSAVDVLLADEPAVLTASAASSMSSDGEPASFTASPASPVSFADGPDTFTAVPASPVALDGEPAALDEAGPVAVAEPPVVAGRAAAVAVGPMQFVNVPQALHSAAEAAGEAIAVIDEIGEHSFAEFGAAVATLAAGLRARGVAEGTAVAVVLPRDRRVLHAPFAIAEAGGLCVHVDPSTPADRLAYMFETAAVRVVLADQTMAPVLAELHSENVRFDHLVPDNSGTLRVAGCASPVGAPVPTAVVDSAAHGASGTASGTVTGDGAVADAHAADEVGGGEPPVSAIDGGRSHSGAALSPVPAVDIGSSVIDTVGSAAAAPAGADARRVPGWTTPFYVVFTSGTTGRPKGVVVPHGALLNHWANHENRIFAPAAAWIGRTLRIGHGWSTGFDAAWQPTVALLSGHAVVLLGDKVRTDADGIVEAIRTEGIDIFDTSPSMLSRLITAGLFETRDGREHCPLTVLALGGEAISQDTWQRLRGLASTRVINFYGPTETTVEALMADVHDHPAPTIGRTFDGMSAEILDHRLRPVPPGGQGELYLSGTQLALGYLGRPATTATAFVAGPHGRRYRTGDLVRRATDGTVIYEGRVDSQVKINGYRVEPDEATVVLREIEGVHHAAALAFTDSGRTRLGALVVADRPATEIRSAAARRLPQFLVPSRIVHVEQIPLNRNDKLDIHAATALLTAPVTRGPEAEPATDTERALLELITAMRDGSGARIGILDSLVDLGIDSIGVIDLVSRLRGAGYQVAAKDVLAAADLRELAQRIDAGETGVAPTEVTPAGTILPLTALAREIVANGNYRYLAQSQVLTLPDETTAEEIIARLDALALAHPTLRSRLHHDESGPVLIVEESSSAAELTTLPRDIDPATALTRTVHRLDPDAGRMIAATLLEGPTRRLLLSIHHLAVDVVSWLFLADDLRILDQNREVPPEALVVEATSPNASGAPAGPEVPAGAGPLGRAAALDSRGQPDVPARSETPVIRGAVLGARYTDPARDRAAHTTNQVVEFDAAETEGLLTACADHGVTLDEAMLVAAAAAFPETADATGDIALTRESHGRPADDDSRRVGWFTVEETLAVPARIATNWTPAAGPPELGERDRTTRAQVRLNHLGRFDLLQFGSGPWSPVPLAEFTAEFGVAVDPELPLRFTVDLTTAVVPREGRPVLVAQFDLNSAVLDQDAIAEGVRRWRRIVLGYLG
ncbi:condensation domain-containing protein [Nocardia sp. NPDC058176]|uniref:condensation domain-containing protein n=1 Tax=Nocardia sp. NPDC058176 TaxID=3346368 RepID=UPI0036DA7176